MHEVTSPQSLLAARYGTFTLEGAGVLHLRILPGAFAVAKLSSSADLGAWAHGGELVQIVRTPNELSIVCSDDAVPPGVTVERGWRCFASADPLDLNQTGVLASLSGPLAEAQISIFVISTFDNDYVLVHGHEFEHAIEVLESSGFTFESPPV
jgi:uncharacterized protein